MSIMEIVLLLAGGIVFILSFMIPAKKEEDYEETRGLAKEEIRNLVSEELEAVRGHVDDVVEEAVTYSIEKTERSLERLSNEKIMAVNEYSDTVLSEIHKNHEEVMFLYDMLNDKHINLKNTVSEVNKTVKEVAETKREAEEVVNTFQRLAPKTLEVLPTAPVEPIQSMIPVSIQPQQSVRPIQYAQVPEAAKAASKPLKTTPAVPVELIQPQISAFVQPVEPQQYVPPMKSVQPVEPQQYVPPVKSVQPVEPQQYVPPVKSVQPVEPQQYVPPVESVQPVEPQQYVPPVESVQPVEPQQVVPLAQFAQPAQVSKAARASLGPSVTAPVAQVEPMAQISTFVPQKQAAVKPEPAAFRDAALPTGAISFTQETDEQGRNYNDVILDLYKKGKSKVAIAKELNLGVGEVKLVIDLYKNL